MDQAKSRSRILIAAALAVVLVGIGAFAIGRLSTSFVGTPSNTSAAAGFARDMQVHHNQGVELAIIIRDASDDPDIRLLAYDIATTQSNQSGQMQGWLNSWQTLEGEGHAHGGDSAHSPGDPMPGLATDAQIAELRSLTGPDAEKLFLELMIAHHQGAVEMAEAVLDRTDVRVVTQLATTIVTSQSSEIEYMTALLARY